MHHLIDIHEDGRVKWQGVDTGKTTVAAHNEKEKVICLKIAGHYYSSMQTQNYAPAHFTVYRYKLIGPFTKSRLFASGFTIRIDELFGVLQWNVRGSK